MLRTVTLSPCVKYWKSTEVLVDVGEMVCCPVASTVPSRAEQKSSRQHLCLLPGDFTWAFWPCCF